MTKGRASSTLPTIYTTPPTITIHTTHQLEQVMETSRYTWTIYCEGLHLLCCQTIPSQRFTTHSTNRLYSTAGIPKIRCKDSEIHTPGILTVQGLPTLDQVNQRQLLIPPKEYRQYQPLICDMLIVLLNHSFWSCSNMNVSSCKMLPTHHSKHKFLFSFYNMSKLNS